jgi:hypothetical protein
MGNRYYPIGDKELASVTTITGLADKSDALIPWAVNCAVDYIKDNHTIDSEISVTEPAHAEVNPEIWEKARTEWRTVRDEAGDIGTEVHDLLELYLNAQRTGQAGSIGTIKGSPVQLLFSAAIEKLKELGPYTVLATEQKVVNEDEWYAGRFDALLEVDGETWLIDFKTGGAFYPEWGLQLAAYAEAWYIGAYHEWFNGGMDAQRIPDKVDRIKVLRLDKKTLKAHWKEYGGEKDTLTRAWYYRAFLGLRDAFYPLRAKKAIKQAFMEDMG